MRMNVSTIYQTSDEEQRTLRQGEQMRRALQMSKFAALSFWAVIPGLGTQQSPTDSQS